MATIGRVLAIPPKRRPRNEICYLTATEVTALLAAPDPTTRAGRRDHSMFQLAVTAGLRVSELTGLRVGDIHLDTGAHVLCHGKGRENRATPLDRQTVQILKTFTAELPGNTDHTEQRLTNQQITGGFRNYRLRLLFNHGRIHDNHQVSRIRTRRPNLVA
ncbi:tyrosine-type recombinase/integrase [Mycolicibacter sp. MYC123]|uniref:Tyrosine-type recombinase/integrase n=1 Tax=[Mycobacterium] zoologicum TaxID=2872311 RepID=A0ABU5YKG1_9MYCO|nr:tyrosine-type recombinase/integrase [Mycolicibacter sp. MYC123]MEB3049484.1 tyrosine-type recombinase/integrase [Mycolicibacter sp. MYC123]